MVDSANQSVAQLKAELADTSADADEARGAAEAAERRLLKVRAAGMEERKGMEQRKTERDSIRRWRCQRLPCSARAWHVLLFCWLLNSKS